MDGGRQTVAGMPTRDAEELATREEALRLYTQGSAWFTHDDTRRGTLEPGKLADLAVLTADYMTVPEDAIANIESLLTMVGGRIVYATGPYAELERPSTP
jgi:predicted amidohydrolase YtcJ